MSPDRVVVNDRRGLSGMLVFAPREREGRGKMQTGSLGVDKQQHGRG